MSKTVALNQTDVSLVFRILADATGVPNTGVTNSTTGFDMYYVRDGSAPVSGGVSTSDLSSAEADHTDWAFIHLTDGWYRGDWPDAAFAEGVGSVLCGVTADSFTGIGVIVDIEPLYRFQGNPDTVVSTTRTRFPSGVTPLPGDVIMVVDGTGDPGNQVLVTSVSVEEAVHAPFNTGISAADSTVLLIAGDSVTARGGINCDVSASTLATPADVLAQCSAAVASAGLLTSAQALTYHTAVTSAQETLKTGVNVGQINGTTVAGAGTSADLWRGA